MLQCPPTEAQNLGWPSARSVAQAGLEPTATLLPQPLCDGTGRYGH